MAGIEAVLLDQGNTVLEYGLQGRWREFLVARLRELHPRVVETCGETALSPEQFAATVGEVIGGERAHGIEHSGHSWHFGERLNDGLRTLGLEATEAVLARLADEFYAPIRESTRPYRESQETLAGLRALGVKLAIITNSPWDTPSHLLRGDLEHWGLEAFFDAFVCSGDVAWRKPNPAFMLAAAQELSVLPDNCLVVGDRIEIDIAGAQAARMRSVWVRREARAEAAPLPAPDWVLDDLGDLPRLVEEAGALG